MTDVVLLSPSGTVLNARVEQGTHGLTLHNRSGTIRNRNYRQALEAAGYPIVRKGEAIPGGGVEPIDSDLAAAEGTVRACQFRGEC